MKRILAITFSLIAVVSICGRDYVVDKKFVVSNDVFPKFMPDSVIYSDEFTRICGKVIGTPHTSDKIDKISIVTPGGCTYVSMDIDGIDYHRWFQWEDNGEIYIEIDFAPIGKCMPSGFLLNVYTSKGVKKWVLKH